MEQIGIFNAKTQLSKLAAQVRRTGRGVTLTCRGEPYVDLVPHREAPAAKKTKKQVLAELAKLRKSLPKSPLAQIQADLAEGRR